jgi:hypothetical protein
MRSRLGRIVKRKLVLQAPYADAESQSDEGECADATKWPILAQRFIAARNGFTPPGKYFMYLDRTIAQRGCPLFVSFLKKKQMIGLPSETDKERQAAAQYGRGPRFEAY